MSNDDGNPFGLTPDEIDRQNGWFRVALAMGKHDSFVEMLQTAGERRAAVAMSEQTKHDEHDRLWFDNGWDACRREVLAVAEHQGDTEAVGWASRHPAGQHEASATADVTGQACKKCGAYGGNGRLPRMDDTLYPCPACNDGVE